ncbi:hypothetical protein Tco_1318222 [Tanacetum coccineum]
MNTLILYWRLKPLDRSRRSSPAQLEKQSATSAPKKLPNNWLHKRKYPKALWAAIKSRLEVYEMEMKRSSSSPNNFSKLDISSSENTSILNEYVHGPVELWGTEAQDGPGGYDGVMIIEVEPVN